MILALACLLCLVVTALLCTPRACAVDGHQLKVKTFLLTFTFDLRKAVGVFPVAPHEVAGWGTVRLFGIGRPLKPVGWFCNARFGTFLNLANDSSRMCLVQFPRRRLVVSPAGELPESLTSSVLKT